MNRNDKRISNNNTNNDYNNNNHDYYDVYIIANNNEMHMAREYGRSIRKKGVEKGKTWGGGAGVAPLPASSNHTRIASRYCKQLPANDLSSYSPVPLPSPSLMEASLGIC